IEPDSQCCPSGVTAQLDSGLGLTGSAVSWAPFSASQRRRCPSHPPVRTWAPSGVYAQPKTSPSCRSPGLAASSSRSVPTVHSPSTGDGLPPLAGRALPWMTCTSTIAQLLRGGGVGGKIGLSARRQSDLTSIVPSAIPPRPLAQTVSRSGDRTHAG